MSQVTVNGQSLAQMRIDRGLSQRALAKEVGISSGYLSEIEAELKIPRPGVAKRIADALGVNVGTFYRLAQPEPVSA